MNKFKKICFFWLLCFSLISTNIIAFADPNENDVIEDTQLENDITSDNDDIEDETVNEVITNVDGTSVIRIAAIDVQEPYNASYSSLQYAIYDENYSLVSTGYLEGVNKFSTVEEIPYGTYYMFVTPLYDGDFADADEDEGDSDLVEINEDTQIYHSYPDNGEESKFVVDSRKTEYYFIFGNNVWIKEHINEMPGYIPDEVIDLDDNLVNNDIKPIEEEDNTNFILYIIGGIMLLIIVIFIYRKNKQSHIEDDE